MKAFMIILSLVFVSCVTSGVKARSVAQESCNIENYKDFIKTEGVHKCDLRGADLRGADLRFADLRFADLRFADLRFADLRFADLRWAVLQWANLEVAYLIGAKVTQDQAEYLKSEGLSGFVVVE